jgi:hypothetical protein
MKNFFLELRSLGSDRLRALVFEFWIETYPFNQLQVINELWAVYQFVLLGQYALLIYFGEAD